MQRNPKNNKLNSLNNEIDQLKDVILKLENDRKYYENKLETQLEEEITALLLNLTQVTQEGPDDDQLKEEGVIAQLNINFLSQQIEEAKKKIDNLKKEITNINLEIKTIELARNNNLLNLITNVMQTTVFQNMTLINDIVIQQNNQFHESNLEIAENQRLIDQITFFQRAQRRPPTPPQPAQVPLHPNFPAQVPFQPAHQLPIQIDGAAPLQQQQVQVDPQQQQQPGLDGAQQPQQPGLGGAQRQQPGSGGVQRRQPQPRGPYSPPPPRKK